MFTDFNGGTRANPKMNITDVQKEFLLNNYLLMSNKDMAAHLGVSESKVASWLKELDLIKKRVFTVGITNTTNFFKHDKNIATI